MASITSLGVHTPAALQVFVDEGWLPRDPQPNQYQRQVYHTNDCQGEVQEEILFTPRCVVWCQRSLVKSVYRFGSEDEDVQQVLLTHFALPPTSARKPYSTQHLDTGPASVDSSTGSSSSGSRFRSARRAARAVTILFKTKIHVHYAHGEHQIVPLPFEIDRAFAAPRGLILQRKACLFASAPPTPQVPAVPNNSFLSFRHQPTTSFLASTSLHKSYVSTHTSKLRPTFSGTEFSSLFEDIVGHAKRHNVQGQAALYILANPLGDLGEVAYGTQQPSKPQTDSSIEFDTLDEAEQVVYVSEANELHNTAEWPQCCLMLIATYNKDLLTLTIWHAWYVDEKPMAVLLKRRAEHKAAKARRRSSFLSMTNAGTGTATPAVRHRDGARESFAGEAQLQVPSKRAKSRARQSSRKLTQQEEEDAFVHQLDPDYNPAGSQPVGRQPSRRISSMVSRSEADPRASQQSVSGHGARRHTSFGPIDRRSFSHSRRSRGSSPGSAYSRTFLGIDDDSMDMDITFDEVESIDSILKHIRATYDAASTDTALGGPSQGSKRELVVRKIHSFEIPSNRLSQPASSSGSERFRIATLYADGDTYLASERCRLGVWIHDRQSQWAQCLTLDIYPKPLWLEQDQSDQVAVPVVVGVRQIGQSDDMIKLNDRGMQAVLLNGYGLSFNTSDQNACALPTPAPYRMYHKLQDTSVFSQSHLLDFGKNRVLQPPTKPVQRHNAGASGTFDETGADQISHRRRLQLRPFNKIVRDLLEVCGVILPPSQSQILPRIWCRAHSLLVEAADSSTQRTSLSYEIVAFTATVLVFAVEILDRRARAALNVSKLASSPRGGSQKYQARHRTEQYYGRSLDKHVWNWAVTPAALPSSGKPPGQDQLLLMATTLADELVSSIKPWADTVRATASIEFVSKLMTGLHIYREEQKLRITSPSLDWIAAVTTQLGAWLGLHSWSGVDGEYYAFNGGSASRWAYVRFNSPPAIQNLTMQIPIGIFQWWEQVINDRSSELYPLISTVSAAETSSTGVTNLTPRLSALNAILKDTDSLCATPPDIVQAMDRYKLTLEELETFPASVAAPFREAIAQCERTPPPTWSCELLRLVGRDDLQMEPTLGEVPRNSGIINTHSLGTQDVQSVCHLLEQQAQAIKTKEANRHAVSRLIFCEDRRLVEAINLMHFNSVQVAECAKQPDWSDAEHLEQQRRVTQWVMVRMIALPAGDGMLHFDSQTPLLTEKFTLPGFNANCVMFPMGHTVTTDRSGLTEERVNWAYFHAGVSAGLRISRSVKGIDTSWVVFNRPNELTNRHAGLLLALGLNGHLRNIAKWLSFKYLTPKHTMTSIALLLGLSASYMGTMDSLITRMLSVHITKMLPPGAAELNVSPLTQTAGLMGIGLLYFNTQHRRMSEMMLAEVEFMETEDPDDAPDTLHDESYRLAAGFALGYIHLGCGSSSRGLHGMQLPERLLSAAVGPRPVGSVHIFDKSTAAAVVALTLIYMKTGDSAIARKIDVPDTEAQFDQVRPDLLLLRTTAKHVIMWKDIDVRKQTRSSSWISQQLPRFYRTRTRELTDSAKSALRSCNIPFFNVCTGTAWALSLKYAGSGNNLARDEILKVLNDFYNLMGRGEAYYYDSKIARSALRRCIDVLAVSAALVMAGTGDLEVFRRLRRLHGRTDTDTPYGSHFAAHLAIGILFIGGGTYTFGTSNLAIASLICATYPLYPTEVQDNRVHLQAFRHFWVFAVEARCIVVEDFGTSRPIQMNIAVEMKDGTSRLLRAPCLLPDLYDIARILTVDSSYWQVVLDFASNPTHLKSFQRNQHILVRRCPAAEAHRTVFGATLGALNDAQSSVATGVAIWRWVLELPALKDLDKADMELILPPDMGSSTYIHASGCMVDDRIVFRAAAVGNNSSRDALWNLRCLFAWAGRVKGSDRGVGEMRWLRRSVIEGFKAAIEERMKISGSN
ncbi:hypothetical protein K431DRAFT_282872 [Polychaeton citri CBS 116435]|uniref:Anaphase-promoting complex subunit 1 N-terminal domain-containing protein n=1 Tax=Polychaeton citri CBS 116435 TaxID=1314669 RepID=A0A9P4QEF2_9PEZI|nr:hypothetical protein K431DRAFT_282872 [Polychaeton citri CBS 116435]